VTHPERLHRSGSVVPHTEPATPASKPRRLQLHRNGCTRDTRPLTTRRSKRHGAATNPSQKPSIHRSPEYRLYVTIQSQTAERASQQQTLLSFPDAAQHTPTIHTSHLTHHTTHYT